MSPGRQVLLLRWGELVDGDPQGQELQPGDVAVDGLGHPVDMALQPPALAHDVLGGQGLRSETRVGPEVGGAVGALPGELGLGAAEVAVGGGLPVDGPAEVEVP